MTSLSLFCCRISSRKKAADTLDDDVETEKRRLFGAQGQSTDALTVRGLSKQYRLHNFKHLLAVKDLTFGVSPGEVGIYTVCGFTNNCLSAVIVEI